MASEERQMDAYCTMIEARLAEGDDKLLSVAIKLGTTEARLAEAERLVAGWLHDGRLQTFEDRERVRGEMRAWLADSASGGLK